MIQDASAATDAALACDFEEARFRARTVALQADALGLSGIATAAAALFERLGLPGTAPAMGWTAAILRLASCLDDLHESAVPR